MLDWIKLQIEIHAGRYYIEEILGREMTPDEEQQAMRVAMSGQYLKEHERPAAGGKG